MLYDILVADRLAFRKSAETAIEYGIATLLLGEVETESKRSRLDISDDLLIKAAKALVKSNLELIRVGKSSEKIVRENEYLRKFIPLVMGEDALRSLMEGLVFGSVGEAMKAVNEYAANNGIDIDKKMASQIAREMLS